MTTMDQADENVIEGGCLCGAVRYRHQGPPIFTHCCHCRNCQRSTGAAFQISHIIETEQLTLLQGDLARYQMVGGSGKRRQIFSCPTCHGSLFGTSELRGPGLMIIMAGSLDSTDKLRPGAHIWTSRKQTWLTIADGLPQFQENYIADQTWPADSLARAAAARARGVNFEP